MPLHRRLFIFFFGCWWFVFFSGQGLVFAHSFNFEDILGERLEYIFTYIGLPLVRLNLEVDPESSILRKIPCYRLIASTERAIPLPFLGKTKYEVKSYLSMDNFKPLKFYKKRIRPQEVVEDLIDFYYPQGYALWGLSRKPMQKIPLPKNTYDLLSLFYYFRALDFSSGKRFSFYIIFGGKIWPVFIKVLGREKLWVGREKKETWRVEVKTPFTKSFIKKKVKFTVYFSDEPRHIPLIVKLHLGRQVFHARLIKSSLKEEVKN